jgi:hypothetical protein
MRLLGNVELDATIERIGCHFSTLIEEKDLGQFHATTIALQKIKASNFFMNDDYDLNDPDIPPRLLLEDYLFCETGSLLAFNFYVLHTQLSRKHTTGAVTFTRCGKRCS